MLKCDGFMCFIYDYKKIEYCSNLLLTKQYRTCTIYTCIAMCIQHHPEQLRDRPYDAAATDFIVRCQFRQDFS